MKPRIYSSEAIILARKDYGEADRILVVYTKDYGKVSLIAKGVRKLKSKKRGSLEVFSQIKFGAARGKGLDIMTEVNTINSFSFRKNLAKVSLAYFFVESVGRLTKDEETNEELFGLLTKSLGLLENKNNLKDFRLDFISKMLTLFGYWPEDKKMDYPDKELEKATERKMTSVRVGKKILS